MQILFAVGLLLTVASAALWVRGLWVEDWFVWGKLEFDDDGDCVELQCRVMTNCNKFVVWYFTQVVEEWPRSVPFGFVHDEQPAYGFALLRGSGPIATRLGFDYVRESSSR